MSLLLRDRPVNHECLAQEAPMHTPHNHSDLPSWRLMELTRLDRQARFEEMATRRAGIDIIQATEPVKARRNGHNTGEAA